MTDAASLIPWLVVLPVVAVAIGWFVGRRRVHELELELAQARAAIQTNEALVQEREQALELSPEGPCRLRRSGRRGTARQQ